MGLIDIIEKPMISGSKKFPGLPLLPHGIERYVVPGCGSRGLEIKKGDEITIVDKEGLQLGELVIFNPLGISDASILGAKSSGKPEFLIKLLSTGDQSGQKVLDALSRSNFDINNADAIRVFQDGSKPGDIEEFVASSDGLLIVAATGEHMLPEAQNVPTELIVYILFLTR